jgi:hypothetical protein
MTVEEISRRAKEKFIKAKKKFKDGDFFKVANKSETLVIGCFESIESDSHIVYISCHFFYFVKGWVSTVITNHAISIDFDRQDLIKASPEEVMFVVGKLKNSGRYYDRRTRKVKDI